MLGRRPFTMSISNFCPLAVKAGFYPIRPKFISVWYQIPGLWSFLALSNSAYKLRIGAAVAITVDCMHFKVMGYPLINFVAANG